MRAAQAAQVMPSRSSSTTFTPRSADRHPARGSAELLRQGEAEHAVLVFGAGALRVDLARQREAARHGTVGALAVDHLLVLLRLLLLPHFGAQRHAAALDVDVDVLLPRARDLGEDGV